MTEQATNNNQKWSPEVCVTLKNINVVVEGFLKEEENEIHRDRISITMSMQPNKRIVCNKSNVAEIIITFGVKYFIDIESYEKIIT